MHPDGIRLGRITGSFMFWFIGRGTVAAHSPAERLTRQRRLARAFYRCTMVMAALLSLAAVMLPMLPRPHFESKSGQLWLHVATDATLRKACVLAAVGLWLIAVLFFRGPGEPDSAAEDGTQHELDH